MAATLKPTGNLRLVDYGIHTEGSDLRAHVCVNAETVYVYPTSMGVKAIESGKYRKVAAFQPGVSSATAEGFLVPPSDIWGAIPIRAGWAMRRAGKIFFAMSTKAKGDWAVRVVQQLLAYGYFPLWGNNKIIESLDMQIQGVDIVVTTRARIQVKCDYEGGAPKRAGAIGARVTGNLFLQVAECNPYRAA